jgi:hypothetical protein
VEVYDYDHNLFSVQGAGDEKLFVQFHKSFLKNEGESIAQGRPIFDDTIFVKIFTPGDRNNIIDRPATEIDKRRFAKQFAAFEGDKEQTTGTPLAEWPVVSRSMAEELKYMGFVTVEQLANAGDAALSKMAGLSSFKAKAAAYLELAAGSTKPIEKLTSDLEQVKAENERLAEAVRTLQGQLHNSNIAAGKAVREKEVA